MQRRAGGGREAAVNENYRLLFLEPRPRARILLVPASIPTGTNKQHGQPELLGRHKVPLPALGARTVNTHPVRIGLDVAGASAAELGRVLISVKRNLHPPLLVLGEGSLIIDCRNASPVVTTE